LLKGPVLRILLFAYDPVWCSKPPAGGWPYLPTAWADGWDDDHSVHCIAPTLRPRWAATSPLGSFPGETSKWSATFRVGPSSSPLPSPARRRSALRRPTAISGSPRQDSMRSQPNLDGLWTSPRSRNTRRPKSWQPVPPTRTSHGGLRRGRQGRLKLLYCPARRSHRDHREEDRRLGLRWHPHGRQFPHTLR
jgi:hypothetical protein